MAVQPNGRPKAKTAFKKTRSIGPLYTGGPIAVTADGTRLVTCVAEDVLLTDVASGQEICRFMSDTEVVHSLCITPSASHLVVFTASHALRIYELPQTNEPLTGSKRRVPPTRVVGRAHDAPVHICKADPTSTYLASGSADGVVKVWDIARGYVTHVFKGHGGVVSALAWNYPAATEQDSFTRERTMHLVTASVDTKIRIFNLIEGATTSSGGGKPEAVLEGHVSVPRGLDVSRDGRWLVSGGRDSVVLLWDLAAGSSGASSASAKSGGGKKNKQKTSGTGPALVRTIPTLERVEAVGFVMPHEKVAGTVQKEGQLRFYTGGEKGVVKIWDANQGEVLSTFGEEVDAPTEDMEEQRQIMDVVYLPSQSTLISAHADQNIIFYSLKTNSFARQMIGYNDEIVDATFMNYPSTGSAPKKDSHLALASNSSLIRVYSTATLDARLLEGHSEIVLALDTSADGTVLVSGSKDKTARVWAPVLTSADEVWDYRCVSVCEGHAESVGAIAMARSGSAPSCMFTGSQDRTIKMWDLTKVTTRSKHQTGKNDDEESTTHCKSLTTVKAHEKDINSLDVSPNDRFLVSGSQDRTAKIYEITYIVSGSSVRGELKHIGTCKGHKRGVWSVKFSSAERILATGSGDKTVKLWSLDDYSCLKTFEGHTNSVLRVDFINMGTQIVTTASDGLVKVWTTKDEECVATLDNHEDKVWALAITSDESTIVSGAADSVVTFWEDCTEEQEADKEAQRADMVLKDQDFMNYLALHDYKRAIELALAMSQPGRLFSLFKTVTSSLTEGDAPSGLTGNKAVDEVLRTLAGPELAKLLRYARDWNTSAKTSAVAQHVLYAIFKLRPADDIIAAFTDESTEKKFTGEGEDDAVPSAAASGRTALKEIIDALIPYSERHLSRMERLVQDSYMIDYILGEMDGGVFDAEFSDDEDDSMDVDLIRS